MSNFAWNVPLENASEPSKDFANYRYESKIMFNLTFLNPFAFANNNRGALSLSSQLEVFRALAHASFS